MYPDRVDIAMEAVAGSGVTVTSLATGFPSGRTSLPVKLAVGTAVRQVCHDAAPADPVHLKVILETGELMTCDNVRRASWLALLAGADVTKTSTGKIAPAATPPVTLVRLQAVRDFAELTGEKLGAKAAGGIRTTKDALRYLVLVHETAGVDWLHPDLFRSTDEGP